MRKKRRRSVSLDLGIISSLKKMAVSSGTTHTTLTTDVILGRAPSVCADGRIGKKSSVSMRESLWLSIRARAESQGLKVSYTAESILLGEQEALSEVEISLGEDLAEKRESERIRIEEISAPSSAEPPTPLKFEPEKKVEVAGEVSPPECNQGCKMDHKIEETKEPPPEVDCVKQDPEVSIYDGYKESEDEVICVLGGVHFF